LSDATQHNKQMYLLAIEAAALLRCHPRTVSGMIASGQLKATKVARRWRIRRSDIEALLPGGAA
jgi:excisionase family DNA binding protein